MEFDIQKILKDARNQRALIPFGVSFDTPPGRFPKDVPVDHAKTSKAFLFAWSVERMLIRSDAPNMVDKLPELQKSAATQEKSPLDLFEAINCRFMPDYLLPEAKSFLLAYDWPGWDFRYEEDFDKVFVIEYSDALLNGEGFITRWHVPPTWTTYKIISPILDKRFGHWRASSERHS